MKNLIVTILFSLFCAIPLIAQNDKEPKSTPPEIKEAKQLAARFYTRLAQTQDVPPLIKEFFIRDFGKWYKSGLSSNDVESIMKNASLNEIRRFYTIWINYFYLHCVFSERK